MHYCKTFCNDDKGMKNLSFTQLIFSTTNVRHAVDLD